jgi:2-hydroxychromene-2-carboxylate isomerase
LIGAALRQQSPPQLENATMPRTIDFYFDFPSPYAYLAHTQLPKIAATVQRYDFYRARSYR